jgi:cysteine desulfurase family protein (TIGR01976 family)
MNTSLEDLRQKLREEFPPLSKKIAFLDNAAGSLVPRRVIDAISEVLSSRGVCNSMMSYSWGLSQLDLKAKAHEETAKFLNADTEEITIGPSATAMAFRLSAALSRKFVPGDAVVLSGLEHECNASPWRELPKGVEIRVWEPKVPDGNLCLNDLELLLADGKVKLVALTAASNAFGLRTDVSGAAAVAHKHGAQIICDSVHGAPHNLPDVKASDVDYLLFSPYKICAPHLGVLYIRKSLITDLDVPTLFFYDKTKSSKFEYGTPQFELLAGWIAALDYFVKNVGGASETEPISRAGLVTAFEKVEELELPIKTALIHGLSSIKGVTIYGSKELEARVGTVAFRVDGILPSVVAKTLGEQGIFVAAGDFYARMPCNSFGVLPDGVVRASIAHYTNLDDIDRLVTAIKNMA